MQAFALKKLYIVMELLGNHITIKSLLENRIFLLRFIVVDFVEPKHIEL